jgi:hypothetical protein
MVAETVSIETNFITRSSAVRDEQDERDRNDDVHSVRGGSSTSPDGIFQAYNAQNPFDFMEYLSLTRPTFEGRVSEVLRSM